MYIVCILKFQLGGMAWGTGGFRIEVVAVHCLQVGSMAHLLSLTFLFYTQ